MVINNILETINFEEWWTHINEKYIGNDFPH